MNERRQQQLPRMPTRAALQNLDEVSHRPAAARQLRIERGMACGHHALPRTRKLGRPPDVGQVQRGERAKSAGGHGRQTGKLLFVYTAFTSARYESQIGTKIPCA
jgi:hypothetical protein